MKYRKHQDGQAGAGDLKVGKTTELSDDALDTVTGGRSDAAIRMQIDRNAVSPDIQPQPINELLGKVRAINYA
jgi:hypothetical protein